MSAEKYVKNYLAQGVNIRREAEPARRLHIQLFGGGPIASIRSARAELRKFANAVEVDKFHKLGDGIVGRILQYKNIFRL